MGIVRVLICFVTCWVILTPKSWALETVTLQLKWKHQFQFAGYYAAREKGYYRDAGLDVIIREAQPGQDPIQQVIQGNANYGVGTSELMLEHSHGAPVVVLAVIFQHSPLGLVISNSKKLTNLQDLVGQSVMIEPNSSELFAYLEREGLYSEQFNLVEHSFDIKDLLEGKVAAMSIYVTDEPFALKQSNHDFVLFEPRMGGIDFYGDNLFTTTDELEQNPERARAFMQASLKGWKYAMQNRSEIIDLIYSRYSKRHSKPHLEFEANKMQQLMQPSLVEPGYMHSGRWEHIALTYKEQGKLPPTYTLEGFLYQPTAHFALQHLTPWIIGIASFSLLIIFASFPFLKLNRKLTASQNWLTTIVDNAPNALIIVNEQGIIKNWNQHAEKFFGWSAEEVIGKNAYELLIPTSNVAVVKQALEKVFSRGENHTGKEWNITKTGNRILCQWNNAFIENDSAKERYMVSMAIDITKQKHMEDKLKLRAYTDPLTGVNNRNIF
ncbi:MAG: ABC transporter substrate-binding protein, partial [Kangiellaceae bacterium]|nr:ABC transporter substrate-binding protein [Kangiellaceae bacterium]